MPTLDWFNRSNALQTAAQVPYRLLESVSSHGTPATDNLLIQGDNLEALKALLPFYRGQVKCIFIDPPYNTKSAFEHYDDNLEHAQWLSMMLPRLQLLRELLREDGSIWVTIDDNEGHYLKVLMDEVFGRGNFVANVVWEKKYAPQNNAIWLSDSHDHVLVFAKSKNIWRPQPLPRSIEMDARYKNLDGDERGIWKPSDFTISLSGGQRGAQYAKTGVSENIFEITTPSGRKLQPARGRCWAASPKRYAELVAESRIWFGPDGNNVPALKRFLTEVQEGVVAKTIWFRSEVGDNQDAKREVVQINQTEVFGTPKPEQLIQRILALATNEGDLILDSFLGSGTTAAVAHKMGRRWIGIEMGEHAATHCLPRLQKVIDGEQGGISKAVGWGSTAGISENTAADGGEWKNGGGFRFMRLGETIFDDAGRINPKVRFATLAAFIWQQETGTAYDATATTTAAQPGTPYLGTHYIINSKVLNTDVGKMPVSLEISANVHQREPDFSLYLLFNGILSDKRPASGNVLTRDVLAALLTLHAQLAPANTPLVVYGESVRVGPARLAAAGVTFKQIPYDVRAR
jgi:adenine-specific DNA-methyltransferase